MNDSEEKILDELAADLQSNPPCDTQSTTIVIKQPQDLSHLDDLERYVNESAQKSNDILFQVIKNFAADVGDDPERAAALSTLFKSNTDLIKLLNDRIIKSKNNQTRIEIQKLKEQGHTMEKIIDAQQSIITNRDDMFKELFKEAEGADEVDEVEDIEND